jgi:hypothetical protein
MTVLASDIVDWGSLAEAVYISVLVGLGVLIVAALGVVASMRAEDARARGESGTVAVYGAGTVVCIAALLGAVGVGIYLLTQ